MRLNGDQLSSGDDEGEEREQRKANSIGVGFPQPQKLVVVGYALTLKKKNSFLQPKLEGLARNKGILFLAIDLNRPLSDQGPFDVVLHKLSGKDWCKIIEDYRQKHPEVTVLDPPDAIQHVHNRQSMLEDVADLNLSNCYGKVGVPTQLVVAKDSSSIPDEVTKAGLKLPLVAKPLVVDGSAKSHELFLAYDQFSLAKLEPPLVLQEFVNHGGVLFKVYIVGEAIKVVRRFSLPDVSKYELSKIAGIFRFPRVSCAAASADDADLDPGIAGFKVSAISDEISPRQHGLTVNRSEISLRYKNTRGITILGRECCDLIRDETISTRNRHLGVNWTRYHLKRSRHAFA